MLDDVCQLVSQEAPSLVATKIRLPVRDRDVLTNRKGTRAERLRQCRRLFASVNSYGSEVCPHSCLEERSIRLREWLAAATERPNPLLELEGDRATGGLRGLARHALHQFLLALRTHASDHWPRAQLHSRTVGRRSLHVISLALRAEASDRWRQPESPGCGRVVRTRVTEYGIGYPVGFPLVSVTGVANDQLRLQIHAKALGNRVISSEPLQGQDAMVARREGAEVKRRGSLDWGRTRRRLARCSLHRSSRWGLARSAHRGTSRTSHPRS